MCAELAAQSVGSVEHSRNGCGLGLCKYQQYLLFIYITTRVVYTSPYQDSLLWGNPATVHKHMKNFDPKIRVVLAGIVVPDPQGM